MQNYCLGCQTSFEQHQKVHTNESLLIEFKNYSLPIQDYQIKLTILKEIVSFLNCKGGTMYIGIEDTEGKVKGVNLTHKQMDDFMLFMRSLLVRIYPPIDLGNREDVIIHFVPVLVNGKFKGKHVIKIIVKQGNPSIIYCINQKAKMNVPISGSTEGVVNFTYLRQNTGSTKRYCDKELLDLIYERANHPNQKYTPHKNCNPQPILGKFQIQNIIIQNIDAQTSNTLRIQALMFSQQKIRSDDIEYNVTKSNLKIKCSMLNKNDFKKVCNSFATNLNLLNDLCKNKNCQFRIKGQIYNNFIIQNVNKGKVEVNKNKEIVQDDRYHQKYQYLIFLNVKEPAVFRKLLEAGIGKNIKKFKQYQNNMLSAQPNTDEDLKKCLTWLTSKEKGLKPYFFNDKTIFGLNQAKLKIFKYSNDKQDSLRKYLAQTMKGQEVVLQLMQNQYGLYIKCKFPNQNKCCEWYQKLSQDKQLQNRFKTVDKFGTCYVRINFLMKMLSQEESDQKSNRDQSQNKNNVNQHKGHSNKRPPETQKVDGPRKRTH